MRFPRFIAGGAGVRETGLVRAQDIGALTNVGDAEFRAIEQVGRAIGAVSDLGTQAFMSRRALDDTIESGKATQRVQESWNQAEDSVDNFNPAHDLPLPGDPKYLETLTTFGTRERDAFLQSSLRDIEKDATKIFSGIRNPKTKAQLVKQYNDFYADRTKNLKGKLDKVLNDYQIDEMGKLAKAAAANGDMKTSDFYVNKMAEHGLITNVNATKLKTALNELSVISAISEIKSIAIEEPDIKRRAELFDSARKLVQEGTIADATDRLDEIRSINLLEKQLENRDTRNRYKNDVTITVDFGKRIDSLEKPPADETEIPLTQDDVRAAYPTSSPADVAETELWAEVLQGKADNMAGRRTGSGYNNVIEGLAKLSKGTISTKDFLQDLAKARWVEGVITDETYNWARKRATSPYPKHLSEMVDTVLDGKARFIREVESGTFSGSFAIEGHFGTLGDLDTYRYTDAEKKAVGDKVANEHRKLFKWIDAELEKDPNKVFTPKELNNMASQVAATVPLVIEPVDTEPKTMKDFKEEATRLKGIDPKAGRAYWDKWKHKWQKKQ